MGEYTYFKTNQYEIQNLLLKMDVPAFLDPVVNDNREMHERPLRKYATL
jgi:hypothetical protein